MAWWRGDLTFRQARDAGMTLDGRRDLVRAFPGWFARYMFASVAPARTPTRVAGRSGTSRRRAIAAM